MALVKLTIAELNRFLELVGCSGNTADGKKKDKVIKEFVIHAFDDSIETYATDKIGKLFVDIKMKVTVIEPGMFRIGNLASLEKFISTFDLKDTITLNQDGDILRIKRDGFKKSIDVPTVSLNYIETYKTAETIKKAWNMGEDGKDMHTEKSKLDSRIVVKAEDMWQMSYDSQIVGAKHYPLAIIKNPEGKMELKIELGDLKTSMGRITSCIPAVIHSGELGNRYAYGFDNVFNSLSGEVTLYTGSGKPLWIVKKDDTIEARYMISPCRD